MLQKSIYIQIMKSKHFTTFLNEKFSIVKPITTGEHVTWTYAHIDNLNVTWVYDTHSYALYILFLYIHNIFTTYDLRMKLIFLFR